jgi:hypothetical protein
MPVRSRVAVLIGGAVALVTIASPALARSPRLERVALAQADMRRASSALLRQGDLAHVPPGWRPLTTTPDDSAPVCPWQNYSSFTLTGRGQADFQATKLGGAGFVGSTIEILASEKDALGKFAVDTHPGTLSCESEALRKALGPGLTTVTARQTTPKVGEHAVGYEFVYSQAKSTSKTIYVNMLEFVRGRAVAVLDTTNFDTPGSEQTRLGLARDIDRRLQ